MNTILNWNGTDHKQIYLRQLKKSPICYDEKLKLWTVYSYEYCRAILLSSDVHVPEPVIDDVNPLNSTARLLLRNFTRLSNDAHHHASRTAAMAVFHKIKEADTAGTIRGLLEKTTPGEGFNWEQVIGRQLPARLIAAGLEFNGSDIQYITTTLGDLVPIMSPAKAKEDIAKINPVAEVFYIIAKERLDRLGLLTGEQETDDLIICNLVGLFIQSYDGGRGLLCNTVLRLAACWGEISGDYKPLVNETLRYDPPVHNTRRVAVNDVSIGGKTIRAGEAVLVVLAAANLDDSVFDEPERFDLNRPNADQHLTFGLGGHGCVAKYFCIDMAAGICRFLADNYNGIRILQNEFEFGPQLNVRLLKQLMVKLL